MAKYKVEKRIINNYIVEVEADTPEDAILKAVDGDHEPGKPTSENEDGDTFYPSEWRVYGRTGGGPDGDWGELSHVGRTALKGLD